MNQSDELHLLGPYVPDNIMRSKNNLTRKTALHFIFRKTRVDLCVIHSEAEKVSTITYDRTLMCIRNTLEFLYKKMGPVVKHVRILWVRCNVPKESSKSTNILGPEHVNSGYTSLGGIQGNHIAIFRIEEAEKVLVHELIHLWNYDRKLLDETTATQVEESLPYYIKSAYGIRVIESITETIATLLYTEFCIMYDKPTHLKLAGGMALQKKHSINQAAKVLSMQGFTCLNDLKTRQFEENSHVFSYYVIKAALLYNWRCFQRSMVLQNPQTTALLIQSSLSNPLFTSALNKAICATKKTSAKFNASMCMTAALNVIKKKN